MNGGIYLDSIWQYSDPFEGVNSELVGRRDCIFCPTALEEVSARLSGTTGVLLTVHVCPCCGWWTVERWDIGGSTEMPEMFSGSAGALRILTSPNLDLPVQEIRKYLAARYEARFAVNPRVFEETVASVFGDLGYRTRVTGYSHDDGIDVVMDGPGHEIIGVQVKRWKNSVKVEQIRAFAGALILGGMTKGIFVTTAGFQAGVPRTAERFAARGIPIELLNAQRFFDALRIAQINRHQAHQFAVEALLSVPVTIFTQREGACSDKTAIPPEQWILPADGSLSGGMKYIRPIPSLNHF